MKKLSIFVAILLALGLATSCFAESSATSQTGKSYLEQPVYIVGYNNSGSSISSNMIVVIETTAAKVASGSTLGTYIKTSTTAGDHLALGVTDETIANGESGRVCVRGPHKCLVTNSGTGVTLAVGTSLGVSTTAGNLSPVSVFGGGGLVKATLLSATQIRDDSTRGDSPDYSADTTQANLYWVWVR